VRGVVVAADDPSISFNNNVRNRCVVGADKLETRRADGDIHDLADDSSVDNSDDQFVLVFGGNSLNPSTNSVFEVLSWLRSRDYIPTLLRVHTLSDRIIVGHATSHLATLPIAEKYFPEVGFDNCLLPKFREQWCCSLMGSLKSRHVHGCDPFRRIDKTLRGENGLLFACRVERRVAMAIDQRETLTFDMWR
jgi:hypothetical protein